jgi:cell division protein FtsB
MPTRLKRPAFWRHIFFSAGLIAFQGYLGYSVLTGQFGVERQDMLDGEIGDLSAQSASLSAEIESYRHKVSLLRSSRIDPDILTERARELLSMSDPDDIVIMVDPTTGKPTSSSVGALPEDQLNATIEKGID